MMEKNIGKKEKWTNKGTDKPYLADSLLHSTTCHSRCLYQILGTVVPEKSLTKKKSLHTDTEKAKTIYPLYTSYTRGIMKHGT